MIEKLNHLYILVLIALAVYAICEGNRTDQYCNRVVEDIKTGEKFVHEINEIVAVGDTITIFIDTTKVTVKVIK